MFYTTRKYLCTLLLTVLAASTHAATSQTDSLLTLFEQTSGQRHLDVANELMRLLDEEEITDTLLQFDKHTHPDTVAAQVYYYMGMKEFTEMDFNSASRNYEKALEHCKHSKDLYLLGDCTSDLAICYARQGKFVMAIEAAEQTVKCDEALGDKERLMISLNTLTSIYIMSRQPETAEKYAKRSLQIAYELHDTLKMAIRHGTLSELLISDGQYHEAYEQARMAYLLDSIRNDEGKMAVRKVQMASPLHKLGRDKEALQLLTEAKPVLTQVGNHVSLAICLTQLGELMLIEKKWTEAANNFAQAQDIYQATGERFNLSRVLYGQWMALRHTDIDKAAHFLEEYAMLKDSIYQQDVANITADYDARYEVSMLEREKEETQRNNRVLTIGAIIGIVIFSLITIFLLYTLRLKSHNALLQKNMQKTRDLFFANITHELRTPLTVIKQAAEDILQDHDIHNNAVVIIRHGGALLELINQMLDVSKMGYMKNADEGKTWVRGDIVGFLHMMKDSYQSYAEKKSTRIVFHATGERIEMDFVEDFMRKIFRNLIINAIKYSKEGTTIDISAECRNERVYMSVADEGIGIADDQKEHIFEAYYQIQTEARHNGTGIGLSLVKLCVEAMDGEIAVESQLGKGSTFLFSFPQHHDGKHPVTLGKGQLEKENTDELNDTTPVFSAPTDSDANDDNAIRLLITEDSTEVAHYIQKIVPQGCQTYFATNGKEALRKARLLIPDLIITDIMMPEMDGMELCREIRKEPLTSHIPIIMVTAKATTEDRIKGFQAGADAYIEKPFQADELTVRISTLLHQRQMLQMKYRHLETLPTDVQQQMMESEQETNSDSRPLFPAADGTETGRMPDSDIRDDERNNTLDNEFLSNVDRLLEKQFTQSGVDLEQLAAQLCITRTQLNRKIKALAGISTRDYANRLRVEKACTLLRQETKSISQIADDCGFDDVAYFSRFFKKMTGFSPSDFRAGRAKAETT